MRLLCAVRWLLLPLLAFAVFIPQISVGEQYDGLNLSTSTEEWDCLAREPKLLLFNRVPKCGTTSFQRALSHLWNIVTGAARTHHSKYSRLLVESEDLSDKEWTENYQLSVMKKLKSSAARRSLFYNRHMYWIDVDALYTKYDIPHSEQPLSANGLWKENRRPFVEWINVLRDPVNRTISLFYYQKEHGHEIVQNVTLEEAIDIGLLDYNRSSVPEYAQKYCNYYTRWFCGQDPSCRGGDRVALAKAMHVLRTQYSLVGTTDNMTELLWAVQKLYPAWFGELKPAGKRMEVTHTNTGKARSRRSSRKGSVSASVVQKIRDLNENDIILYEWVKEYFGLRIRSCL